MTPRGPAGWMAATLLYGCGVAGQPMPPGPLPPRAPDVSRSVSTPDGLELYGPSSHLDVDGAPIGDPVELWLFAGQGPIEGQPVARAQQGPIKLPTPLSIGTARLVAVRADRSSQPSPPFPLVWSAPPPPPAPVGFIDAAGNARLIWSPVDGEVVEIQIIRDGQRRARLDGDAAGFSEAVAVGEHHYQLIIHGATYRSAASETAILVRRAPQ